MFRDLAIERYRGYSICLRVLRMADGHCRGAYLASVECEAFLQVVALEGYCDSLSPDIQIARDEARVAAYRAVDVELRRTSP